MELERPARAPQARRSYAAEIASAGSAQFSPGSKISAEGARQPQALVEQSFSESPTPMMADIAIP
jgi:hypothetical protein